MKTILFTLSIFISTTLFAQPNIMDEHLFSFQTIEKNKKTIVFSKLNSKINNSFVINAKNNSTKDYTSCEWKLFMTDKTMTAFIQQLAILDITSNQLIENKNFSIKIKKNKMRIKFINTRCSQGHKTHYFQQLCNRMLTFSITEKQKAKIVSQMQGLLQEQSHVKM
jgi:hypothetical protein